MGKNMRSGRGAAAAAAAAGAGDAGSRLPFETEPNKGGKERAGLGLIMAKCSRDAILLSCQKEEMGVKLPRSLGPNLAIFCCTESAHV